MFGISGDLTSLREAEDRLRLQTIDSQQREKLLVRRLAAKEQEMQDVAVSFFFITFLVWGLRTQYGLGLTFFGNR